MSSGTSGWVFLYNLRDWRARGPPADPGSLLPWEHAASTLRKAHRIADRSYFGHGPEDKAGAGTQTQREPKQDSQSRLGSRRSRARMPLRPVTVRQYREDAGRREHIYQDPARPFPRIAVAFRPPWQQRFAPQRGHGIWLARDRPRSEEHT